MVKVTVHKGSLTKKDLDSALRRFASQAQKEKDGRVASQSVNLKQKQ